MERDSVIGPRFIAFSFASHALESHNDPVRTTTLPVPKLASMPSVA
ncbi:MAG: hypothetical protein PV344_03170 [Anaplasma sp.]|nr:hypothetical protein [Anaplasma sp.]